MRFLKNFVIVQRRIDQAVLAWAGLSKAGYGGTATPKSRSGEPAPEHLEDTAKQGQQFNVHEHALISCSLSFLSSVGIGLRWSSHDQPSLH